MFLDRSVTLQECIQHWDSILTEKDDDKVEPINFPMPPNYSRMADLKYDSPMKEKSNKSSMLTLPDTATDEHEGYEIIFSSGLSS